MPSRTFRIYGLGWTQNAQSIPEVNISFNGQSVYTGPVLDYRVAPPEDLATFSDPSVDPMGNPIAEFTVTSVPAGNYPVEIGVSFGSVTVGGISYTDTDLTAYDAMTSLIVDTIDYPAMIAITPPDILTRYYAGTPIQTDADWATANAIHLQSTSNINDAPPILFETKRNVKINGILQADNRVDLNNQPQWHWEVADGDLITFDLVVIKDSRLPN